MQPDTAPGGWVAEFLTDPAAALHTALGAVTHWATTYGPTAAPVATAIVIGLVAAQRRLRTHAHRHIRADARLVTMLVPPEVDPAGAAALWHNLVGLLRPAWKRFLHGQPHLAFEYVFGHEGVRLQMWVPGVVPPGMVERAIESAWPGAHTHTQPAQDPLPSSAHPGQRIIATGGQLRLARTEALPTRTDHTADPLRALLGAPSGLAAREHACVQILARPVTGRRLRKARRAARHLHHGHSPNPVGRLLDLITPGVKPTRRSTATQRPVLDPQTALEYAAQDRATVAKQRGSQYETLIRYAVTIEPPDTATADDMRADRDQVRGTAHAIASAFGVFTEHNHYRRSRIRHPIRTLADRRLDSGDLLSVAELAAIAHLPTDDASPGVQRAGAAAVAPPPGILEPGPGVKPLGDTDSGHSRPIGLRVADARHHLHVLGATGSGKSTLLANLVLADADAGRASVVIDPKGDLVTDILKRLPAHLGEKVVLFDADDPRRAPCLNPLDGDKHRATDHIVSVFARVFSAAWGPRTDDILRAGCLSLHDLDPQITRGEPATLAHLPDLLTKPEFRERVVATITDPVLQGFWSWYDQLSEPARAHIVAPLMNKLRAVLLRPFVRQAIAGGASTVDLDQTLDSGLLLARIPKGSLGEDTTRLVGSLLVASVWQATTRRARLAEQQRPDSTLLVDECHNFLNLPFPLEDMLAEARAYHLSIVLAHQHLDQLGSDLAQGISTNARTKLYFSMSPRDAHQLAPHTAPRMREHDLSHLGAFHAAVRPVLRGEETQPFTIRTRPLPPPVPGRTRTIRKAAAIHAARRPPRPPRPARRFTDPRDEA